MSDAGWRGVLQSEGRRVERGPGACRGQDGEGSGSVQGGEGSDRVQDAGWRGVRDIQDAGWRGVRHGVEAPLVNTQCDSFPLRYVRDRQSSLYILLKNKKKKGWKM